MAPSLSPDVVALATNTAPRYGLDPALVAAVIAAESSGNPGADSGLAGGLMGLAPATAAALGVTNIYDPAQNVDGGSRYLAAQIDRFGSLELALAAYNAGPGAVQEYGGVPPFTETQTYVPRVLGLYADYSAAGLGSAGSLPVSLPGGSSLGWAAAAAFLAFVLLRR